MALNYDAVLHKLVKEQTERIDALVTAQERTNQLLEWLGTLLQERPAGDG